jgi:hypothetical protein
VKGPGQPINQLTAVAAANCVAVKISCDWDMANYEGFTFSPDYLPTGDVLYKTGATSTTAPTATRKTTR